MASRGKLPPRSAYPAGELGDNQRWRDYQLIREGHGAQYSAITESGSDAGNAAPEIEVTPQQLARLETEDPQAWIELRHQFAEAVFAHHDTRRGQSPFFTAGTGA